MKVKKEDLKKYAEVLKALAEALRLPVEKGVR